MANQSPERIARSLELAHKRVGFALGRIGYMIVKRKLTRIALHETIEALERALATLKELQ